MTGHDYDAAMTYIDAAILAKEAGDVSAVRNLVDMVDYLTISPRLTGDERAETLHRLGQ